MLSPELDRIIYASPAFETIWGIAARGLEGAAKNAILGLVDPRDREAVGAAFTRLKAQETEFEHRLCGAGGKVRWVRSRTFPVRTGGGALEKIIAVSEDVTERKELELQLRWKAT